MIATNLNLPNVVYWVIVIIGVVLFCITEKKKKYIKKKYIKYIILGDVLLVLSCIVSGGNGIYRAIVQQENITLIHILLISEFVFFVIALIIDIYATGIIAIPYMLGRYILGCLIMCAPISIINTSKALGGLVAVVAIIIILYPSLKRIGDGIDISQDTVSIVLNGESCMILKRFYHFGGEEIEYRDSNGNIKTLSQTSPGSSLYKTESGETVRLQANGYFKDL